MLAADWGGEICKWDSIPLGEHSVLKTNIFTLHIALSTLTSELEQASGFHPTLIEPSTFQAQA